MQTEENVIPVESDVNQYLKKSRFMLDNDIEYLFKKFNIRKLLHISNINKRTGQTTENLIFDLFFIPFLMLTNVFLFVRTQYENTASKNKYYRLLENARYNWCSFVLNISFTVFSTMLEASKKSNIADEKPVKKPGSFYVVDDSLIQVSGKLIESASYLYDHVSGKTVLGFQKLVLGIFDGARFLPICNHLCNGKTKPKAKSKAKKYKKIPKAERIPVNCPGALEREMLDKTKLEKTISMLKQAQKKGFSASTVLFDSWFCFNSFIVNIVSSLKLNVICQLKNLPRPNKYLYRGKFYSLKELYAYYAKSRLRMVKKLRLKRSIIIVDLPESDVKMKIVFVQNEGKDKWHAFAATDVSLSAKKILEYYSYRWSIEVFFKSCKQYLNFGKEQMSNLDSIIACDAIVFLRYILLTYLAFNDESTIYEKFDSLRKVHMEITFGMRLLKFFFSKLSDRIQQVIKHIEFGGYTQAISMLKELEMEQNPDIACGMN